jgi:hypothetical protein
MEQQPIRRYRAISKAVFSGYYVDLGETDIIEESTLEEIKLKVVPHEGVHAGIEYTITLKFREEGQWPLIFVDSAIFDRIKTAQYLQNKGRVGEHKGICIKNLGYAYPFAKNFKELCNNQWENYVYYVIATFNNIQDFEKGNGFRGNYKQLLSIDF